MTDHKVVTREEWQAAREELLRHEKEHTRMADELARQRRGLPWVTIEKEYLFDADDGTRTLAGLFDGRSQLVVYHFMFGPSYEAGCPVNSSIADGLDGLLPHLHAHDVTLLLVSRAPLAKLQAYKRRMGWNLPWVSAANTDFNFDFGASYTEEQVREFPTTIQSGLPPIVPQNAAATGTDVSGYLSESPAVSVFTRQDGAVYQTYASMARGVEFLMGYYPILDRTPNGRDEGDAFQTWIRRHDEYAGCCWGAMRLSLMWRLGAVRPGLARYGSPRSKSRPGPGTRPRRARLVCPASLAGPGLLSRGGRIQAGARPKTTSMSHCCRLSSIDVPSMSFERIPRDHLAEAGGTPRG